MSANGEEELKILAIIATPSRIHYEWIRSLIVALGKRGHKITMISPEREEKRLENVETIWIENLQTPARRNFDNSPKDFTLREITKIYNFGVSICETAMRARGVQKLMKLKDSFDLIVMDVAGSQSFYGFVKHFGNPPVVGFSAFGNPPWISDVVGAGAEPFQVPHAAVPYTNRMNYLQRCWNSFLYLFTRYYRRYFVMPRMKSIMERYFENPDDPGEIERNFSFLLVNTDSVIDYPQSWPPSVIPVAGLHLTPPDAHFNNEELENFLENSSHGIVYISLGNGIRLNDINPVKLKALLGALRKLEEDVLWHLSDENLPETSGNLKIFKNVPHNDVLGHPRVRVFLTPGGGLSLQESIYHGVPILCLPFSSNDRFNARRSVSLQVGAVLDYSKFTEERIFNSLRRVLDDSRYAENAKKLSKLFRDQPTRPLERAIFWTEYAARNSSSQHLRLPAREMSWFQTSMVDLAIGYSAVFLIASFLFFVAAKTTFGISL